MRAAILITLIISSTLNITKGQDLPDLGVINRIKHEATDNSQVMDIAFQLTDQNGPRLTGSPGCRAAEAKAVKMLQDWGLSNVALEPWGTFGKSWENKRTYIAMSAPYYQPLIGIAKPWTESTNGEITGVPILVKINSEEDIEQYKGQLKGKMIIVDSDPDDDLNFDPDARRYTDDDLNDEFVSNLVGEGGGHNYTPEQIARYRKRRKLSRKLTPFYKEEGVSLIISKRRGDMGTVFTSSASGYKPGSDNGVPEIEIASEHANRIIRMLRDDQEVVLNVNITNEINQNDTLEYNVIGEIPGWDKKLKAEVVMLGGHLDSWHGATGATDNGAPCAVMMEVMRIIHTLDLKPRRTIRIALWTGEEQGLYGSLGYVKKHFADPTKMEVTSEHDNLSAYYNLDNGAGMIRGIYLQENDAARPIFESWFAPFKDLGAETISINNTGSTDHVAFDRVGLPGFQFIQDPLEYFTRTHHTNMDTYDRLSEKDMIQSVIIITSLVYHTAMRDEKIPRKPLPEPRKKGGFH
ncbi:MAG: M20/M25/M40 family metallo-hydrolase [Flavobacteriales bacterium]|nr:M20/M25/M40 family metallo-hydrolase [Flavobacteriales bacterium]